MFIFLGIYRVDFVLILLTLSFLIKLNFKVTLFLLEKKIKTMSSLEGGDMHEETDMIDDQELHDGEEIEDSDDAGLEHAEGQGVIEEGEDGDQYEMEEPSEEEMHQPGESEEEMCYQAMVREIRDVLNQYRQSLGLDPFYTDLL